MFVVVSLSDSGLVLALENRGRLSDKAELNGLKTLVVSAWEFTFMSDDEKSRLRFSLCSCPKF